jgi:archaeosortase A (PGF-CTERM-specific)
VSVDSNLPALLGVMGMTLLGASWFLRRRNVELIANLGWLSSGLSFFFQSFHYLDIQDYILTIMSALCLPLAVGMVFWERQNDGESKSARHWARGTVAFAGGPYLLIAYIPWLSVLAIWFVASQSALFLRFATGTDIEIGTTYVNTTSGQYTWSDWDGNRFFFTDFEGDYPFQAELLLADGTGIGINFVLACTAIQSMVLFIGAISVLNLSLKKRIQVLFLIIPFIHIMNVFRNAGLIWMHMTYTDWTFYGLSVFEFGHTYVARFVSLFAMFLIALVMFDLLPQMHRNIMTLTGPFRKSSPK